MFFIIGIVGIIFALASEETAYVVRWAILISSAAVLWHECKRKGLFNEPKFEEGR
jgi:hypothetical protein